MTDAIEAGARADLLPCPFCGSAPTISDIEPHSHKGGVASFMPDHPGSSCIECGCGVGIIDEDRDAVTKRWNTRAIASGALVPASAVAEMRERCAKVCEERVSGWDNIKNEPKDVLRWWPDGETIAAAIRQLDISPACGDYVVVPVVPTDAMKVAGGIAAENAIFGGEGDHPTIFDAMTDVWTAMLHAATRTGGEK